MVIESGVQSGVVVRISLAHVCVDSTVMEESIAYPTDSALLEKCRTKFVAFMKENSVSLRQSYSRDVGVEVVVHGELIR